MNERSINDEHTDALAPPGSAVVRVLLIEDDPDDALLVSESLAEARGTRFQIERAERMSTGLERLTRGGIDVVLLDLSLPDSSGVETFRQVNLHRPDVPIVVLTGLDDETLGAELVGEGGQDYLVKGQVGSGLLVRCIDYAIRRKHTWEVIRQLAEENSVIAEIGRIIASTLDIDEVYERFAAEAKKLIPFDRVNISIANPEAGIVALAYTSGIDVPGRRPGDTPPLRGSIAERVIQQRKAMLIAEDDADELAHQFPTVRLSLEQGIRSIIEVPLTSKGEIMGVLSLESTSPNVYSKRHLRLAERIGAQIAGAIASSQLYHERLRVEEELARSNSELEQYAYAASHDLREPLRMLTSYGQILAEEYKDKLDEDGQRIIGYMVDGASRMTELINDLLTVSRVGAEELSLEPTDCHDILNQVVADLGGVIKDSGAEVTYDNLPTVHGDSTQLAQLMQNLVGNGIKFRGEKPPRIHVSAKAGEQQWVFSVQDNGIGISAENRDRIFKMFERLHHRREYPGTGIGLALCDRIARRHKGRIWVESEVGKGSVFYFAIPIADKKEVA